jgi:hypothetical protein
MLARRQAKAQLESAATHQHRIFETIPDGIEMPLKFCYTNTHGAQTEKFHC